jgi:MoaA/NifB/PqqE/SkfB family radical SAM enzyme
MVPMIEHFVRDLTPAQSRALFSTSVKSVSLAISSYCNRQCTYCPNSVADRKSHQNLISDGLFFNVLRQLCAIDYDGIFHIHRYNEPLSDRDYALSRLRDVRNFLPKAHIRIFTNGDYLDRSYLDAIAALGVQQINETVHAGPGGKTDFESLLVEQQRRVAAYGLNFKIHENQQERVRIASATHPAGLQLDINAHDFMRGVDQGNAWAFDRGGVLPIPRKYVRTMPCLSQFSEMEIEWDGTLLPCCQIHNDAFGHDDYVLGKLTAESDIFAAWTNINYVRWRITMSSLVPKASPCTTCSYGEPAPHVADQVLPKLAKLHGMLNQATLAAAQ